MELKPPNPIIPTVNHFDAVVFLAGSIEQGAAEKWHTQVIEGVGEIKRQVLYLNPRRDEWDAAWKQEKNDPNFRAQVDWEREGLGTCDIAFFYFQPGTLSPVSMLELGEFLALGTVPVVVCPQGFWRKGNVDIICEDYGAKVFETLEEGIAALKERLSC